MNIYVASSWRNLRQPEVVAALREAGHEVYDFKNPKPGDYGFRWSEIDPDWQGWDSRSYITALESPVAQAGFTSDWEAMDWADVCVLVLPCGRSAHIEAGVFPGSGKNLVIMLDDDNPIEPELMYKMADFITADLMQVVQFLAKEAS